jgi:pantoate--beta-alanine ligase
VRVATSIAELTDLRDELTQGQPRPTLALVPTMGALHAGHRSLIRLAGAVADVVVVSIFVNPLQFGPDEDYARYPRVVDADLDACREEGVDIVFVPSVSELYPAGRQVTVSAGQLGSVWEGASRPGHFDGVLTVVAKLFNLVRPDKAVFGQKDAQQLAVVRKMATDLNLDVDVVAAPTVRDPDGLALSTRNRYLLPHERTSALALSASVRAAVGQRTPADALAAAREVVCLAEMDHTFTLDYLALVHPQSFAALPDDHRGDAVLLVAARVGQTRLIDSAELTLTGCDDLDLREAELDLADADRVGAPAGS